MSVPFISGLTDVCEAPAATYDAGPGFSTYAWTVDGGATPDARHATPALAGIHFGVSVSLDGCSGAASLPINVTANLQS